MLKKTIVFPVLVALSTGLGSLPVSAASTVADPGITAANKSTPADKRMTLSEDGFKAWRSVRGARIAMFNGNAELATKLISDAEKNLRAATKFAEGNSDKTVVITGDGERTTHWIPVDASIAIVDDYVTDAKKTKHVAAANEHMKTGKKKEAMESLKLAEVDVSYTRVLMPLERFKTAVETATAFAEDGKYYEANLALRTAERAMQSDTLMLLETPKK